MFYIYDLFKIPKTMYRETLFNYRNLAVDFLLTQLDVWLVPFDFCILQLDG